MVQQTIRPLYFCSKPLMIGSVDVACHAALVIEDDDDASVNPLLLSLMLEEAIYDCDVVVLLVATWGSWVVLVVPVEQQARNSNRWNEDGTNMPWLFLLIRTSP